MKYDYLIVGAGLFGAVCAHELNKQGKKVLVIEKRKHIAGNVYTENHDGIQVHKYGAHIFHTNDKEIRDYVNSFSEFNRFTNSPLAPGTYSLIKILETDVYPSLDSVDKIKLLIYLC